MLGTVIKQVPSSSPAVPSVQILINGTEEDTEFINIVPVGLLQRNSEQVTAKAEKTKRKSYLDNKKDICLDKKDSLCRIYSLLLFKR